VTASLVVSKEICLEVNAEKTKYVFLSKDECRRKYNMKIDNKCFEKVKQFRHLGTTLKY